MRDLIQELEESFRESNNVGSNLILRCVFLRAENQNLVHQMDEKKKKLSSALYNKNWKISMLGRNRHKLFDEDLIGKELKYLMRTNQSCTNFQKLVIHSDLEEVDVLHKTIEDLQKKLRERDKKIEFLCQKYLYLKTSKNKMENDLKSKILSLERQLDVTYNTLNDYQNEVEVVAGKTLSGTKNIHEALFLQEKLRCSKLMYEKVRLHHEIKRLEDSIRRQTIMTRENNYLELVKSSLDKCSSEPLMRHF